MYFPGIQRGFNMRYLVIVFLFVTSLLGQTPISGTAGGNWTAEGSPYQIVGNVFIPLDSAVYVSADVEVAFLGDYTINVSGELHVINAWIHGPGAINSTGLLRFNNSHIDSLRSGILCTNGMVTSCESYFQYSGSAGVTLNGADSARFCTSYFLENQTHGLKVQNTDSVRIEYSFFEGNGISNIAYPALYLDGASPQRLRHNIVRFNHGAGIGVWNTAGPAFPLIQHNYLEGNYRGIDVYRASPVIEDNIIVGNGIPDNPASGDGIRVFGVTGTSVLCNRNYIAGNHQGVRNLETAAINLGDMVNDWPGDDGENFFANNSYHDADWNIWNGSDETLMAQNNFWPGLTTAEIDGTIRDDDEGFGGEVVFEPMYAETPPVGDLNQDGLLDIRDLALAVETATVGVPGVNVPPAAHYYQADLDGNYTIDINDFVTLIELILNP